MKRILGILVGFLFCASAFAQANFFLPPASNNGQFNSSIRLAPTYVNAKSLAANTSETDTIPTGANFVLFGANCNFYAKPGATAAVPTDVTDGSASEANPQAWYIKSSLTGMTQISVIAEGACLVTLSYYQ